MSAKLSVDRWAEADDRYTAQDFWCWDLPLALLVSPAVLLGVIVFGPYIAARWVWGQGRKVLQRNA